MRKKENEVRKKMIVVRMNERELEQFLKLQRATTERDASSYLRKVALAKPVTVKYRNESADDFLRDMLLLKKELESINDNLTQAVFRLQMLEKIPEFRVWLQQYYELHQSLIRKVEQIRMRMGQIYEQWLQG